MTIDSNARPDAGDRPRASWVFAFDLDGTVTREELLPRLAALVGKEKEMEELTRRTLAGELPFEASFRLRFGMLASIPLSAVRACVQAVPLDPSIEAFILARKNRCALVTGNLDAWIGPLAGRLGCRVFCSESRVSPSGQRTIGAILRKDAAVRLLKQEGCRVAAIGDAANDEPMFREADRSFAFGGVHDPAPALLPLADGGVFRDGASLCRALELLESTTA